MSFSPSAQAKIPPLSLGGGEVNTCPCRLSLCHYFLSPDHKLISACHWGEKKKVVCEKPPGWTFFYLLTRPEELRRFPFSPSLSVYLIPINFRLPLIFVRGCTKIRGTEKAQLFGCTKLKGTEIISKPFENAFARLDSYFQDIKTQKWWLDFFSLYTHVLQAYHRMWSHWINRAVQLTVHLVYNSDIETFKIPCFVWKEKNEKNEFYKGCREILL